MLKWAHLHTDTRACSRVRTPRLAPPPNFLLAASPVAGDVLCHPRFVSCNPPWEESLLSRSLSSHHLQTVTSRGKPHLCTRPPSSGSLGLQESLWTQGFEETKTGVMHRRAQPWAGSGQHSAEPLSPRPHRAQVPGRLGGGTGPC